MKNAVIYVRISTSNQDVNSQIVSLKKYCDENKYHIKMIFQDEKSGMNMERDGLIECIEYCINPENHIDTLIVWELSRLGRAIEDLIPLIKKLKDNGINLFVKSNGINTLTSDKKEDFGGKLMLTLMGMFAENERDVMMERMKRGKMMNVINKNRWGGIKTSVLYGYQINDDGELIINSDEAEIIKLIFNKYVEGVRVGEIIKYLNNNNIPTRSKKEKGYDVLWREKNIFKNLKNKMYIGKMIYSGMEIDKPEYRIISDELFYHVQDKIKEKRTYSNNRKNDLLLNDIKIICGICGLSYYSKINDRIKMYSCLSKTTYYKNIECDSFSIGINKINSGIYYYLRRNDDIKRRYYKIIQKENPQIKNDNLKNEIVNIENDISLITAKIKRVVNAYIDGYLGKEEYDKRKSKHEDDINNLKNEIINIEKSIISNNNLLKKEYSLNDYFVDIKSSPVNLKDVYNDIIKKIIIYPCKTKIFSSAKNDNHVFIELYLFSNDNPLRLLLSQRTNKICEIAQGVYDYKNHILKTDKLNIKEIIHQINYDIMIKNK